MFSERTTFSPGAFGRLTTTSLAVAFNRQLPFAIVIRLALERSRFRLRALSKGRELAALIEGLQCRTSVCGPVRLAVSLSTSTQPKCKCASFAPTSVRLNLPGVSL
jgi:hypothetical protein